MDTLCKYLCLFIVQLIVQCVVKQKKTYLFTFYFNKFNAKCHWNDLSFETFN